ncbi:MAG: hypothetical protein ACD_7C00157G0005 [uncultured bacterium]|nr:MAG: hypothetical protein ACD_7C00157G0005 [uncultured bacterium]HBR79963.1 hypothetical protein [Candidatus Moranbacteria bacterium]
MDQFCKSIFFVIISFFIFSSSAKNSQAATLYMPDDCPNLQECFSSMLGGDELIIRNGTYVGSQNAIGEAILPPSGNNNAYTTIRAENDFNVIFDGENIRSMFYTWIPREYIYFKGLKWINSNDTAVHIYEWNHAKFIKCAFMNGENSFRVSTVWASSGSNYLFEDCHAWGSGRYSLNIQTSNDVVVRRFVSRLDAVTGSLSDGTAPYPAAHFMSYASQNVEWQNCIALDSDQDYFISLASYYLGGYATHAFYDGEYTENNFYNGCIALNIDMHNINPSYAGVPGPGFLLDGSRSSNYLNCIAWDTARGFSGNNLENYTGSINHSTVSVNTFGGDLSYDGINSDLNLNIANSVIMGGSRLGDGSGIRGGVFSDYNAFYGNINRLTGSTDNYSLGSVAGIHDYSHENGNEINPLDNSLKYITRVESGSDFEGIASDGGYVGANVSNKIGTSGTMYGENDYNINTNVSLWPFPYEDQIKNDFASYNADGINPNIPDGKRGFAEDIIDPYGKPLTLTRYVWQYLENEIPCEIYDECEQIIIRSDVDNSSVTNTTDALLTLRNSLGLSMDGTAWHVSAMTGDVDCSGTSNSTDALLILRYSLGFSMNGTSWCE